MPGMPRSNSVQRNPAQHETAQRDSASREPKQRNVVQRLGDALGALRAPKPRADSVRTTHPDDFGAMLGAVGAALLNASQATSDVQRDLARLATAYDRPEVRSFVLPTVVFVEDGTTERPSTQIYPAVGASLRLDQAGALADLVESAATSRQDPGAVVASVKTIREQKPRFNVFTTIIGHTVLTLGFGMVLNPSLNALPAYLVLGAFVGTIVVFGSRLSTLAMILPIVTALAVTAVTVLALSGWVGEDPLRIVAPPLASFLPGLMLTIAAVELTSNQIMAGATRLLYGIAQIVLLALGVYAGLHLVGTLPTTTHTGQLGAWAPWVGVVLTGIGFSLWSSAPRRSLPWVIAALAVAYSGQLLGNVVLSPELSGFLGAVVVVPFARFISRFRTAPPPLVTTICGFWILVPGALGFIGISEAATQSGEALGTLLQTGVTVVSIAIGMLVGSGISRDIGAVRRAFGGQSDAPFTISTPVHLASAAALGAAPGAPAGTTAGEHAASLTGSASAASSSAAAPGGGVERANASTRPR